MTRPNGVVTTYGYNDADLVTELSYAQGATTLGTLSTTYDALGRPRTLSGSLARTRLPPALASATYDEGNRLQRWGGTSFTFEANGNVTGDGTRSYTWSPGNPLAGVSGPVPASFSYDVLGRRVSKTVGGTSTLYRYDGLNLLQEQQGTPTPTVTATYLSGALDEVFTRTTGTGSESPLTDALGSTLAATDGTGAITATATYGAFGQTAVAGTTGLPLYTGRERDETGLYYYRARYYQPEVGRFLSEDPLEAAGGDANLYAYVGNVPTTYVDPTGEFAWVVGACVGGAAFDVAIEGLFGVPATPLAGRKADAAGGDWSPLARYGAAAARGCASGFAATALLRALGPFASRFAAWVAASHWADEAGVVGRASLKFLHNEGTLSQSTLAHLRTQSTDDIVSSLRPGQVEALRVKPDGTIMNGNHRVKILQERGFDVNSLPRERYPR